MLGSPVRGRTETMLPRSSGPSLQPQPPPWLNCVKRTSIRCLLWMALRYPSTKNQAAILLAFQPRSVVTRAAEAPLFTVSWIDPDVLLISGSSELLLLVALPVSSLLSLRGLLETERT